MAISTATAIGNLLGTYAERIDSGDFTGAAELFRHARLRVRGEGDGGDGTVDYKGVLKIWEDFVIRYADGTPRTKHVITNYIIDADDDKGVASCRSYYTVFQQLDGFPLQPIIAGRYDDRFERVGGEWRFSFRDYSLVELVGDLSHHLRMEIPGA